MQLYTHAIAEKARIVDLRSFRVLTSHGTAAAAAAACATPILRGLLHAVSAANGGVKGIGIYRGDATKRDPKVRISIGAPMAAEAIEAETLYSFAAEIPDHTIEHTKGGLYAVGRFRGPWSGLKGFYADMLDHLIPATGYKYNGGDVLEIYLEADDAQGNVVDVCFPVGK